MSLIPIVIFIFGVFGLIWFRQRHIESWMRNQILAIISPFLLSFIVSSATGVNWYLLIGIVISISVWAWLFRFRFPSLYNQALQKTQAKAFDEAYQLLNQVIQEHPNLWEAYLLRSSVCLILGYFSHAERDAKKAVQLKPTTVSSYTSLGVVFLSQGLLEQAKQTFLEGFRLEPAVAATHINLGITCYRLGEFESADHFLMKVVGKLRSDQEKLFLYYHLGRCQEFLGHKEKALTWYRKMSYYKKSFSLLKISLQDQKFLPANSLFQVDLADLEQKLQ